ncbi:MAG: hypothetical protein K2P81_07480 [Bacteriovoracaceae bacterium]|nr:hypothetical protein [Bacteriovoracaceae bacterium]
MDFSKSLAFIFIFSTSAWARIELPRFAAKQALENIRFMTVDGRITYNQKRSGALAFATSFRTIDILENPQGTNYYITASSYRKKMVIEVEKEWHRNLDLTKNNELLIGTFAGTQFLPIGAGRAPRLHLDDDWITWFDAKEKVIHVHFLRVKDRHYVIKLNPKLNNFYIPEVVMLNPETIMYTDINDKGFAALLSYNIISQKLTVIKKSEVSGTRMELCRFGNYIAMGEFSFDDANRGSSIQVLAWKDKPNLAGFTNLYRVSDNDIGNMVCGKDNVWFVKTMSEDRKLNIRQTEAVSLEINTSKITMRSELERVTNIIEMDGRILLPFREDIFVLEGPAGANNDVLKDPEKQPGRRIKK